MIGIRETERDRAQGEEGDGHAHSRKIRELARMACRALDPISRSVLAAESGLLRADCTPSRDKQVVGDLGREAVKLLGSDHRTALHR